MRKARNILIVLLFSAAPVVAQEGLRGNAAAIADARAMVSAMGGADIWSEVNSLHFVHEWDVVNRADRYLEHEILDMNEARSWVSMASELGTTQRAYSPEHGYWSMDVDGAVTQGGEQRMQDAIARAPFNLYRMLVNIARDDAFYKIEYGELDGYRGPQALVFSGPDDVPGGWVILNARKEPIIWATTQYVYTFGPLARYGNLLVPEWAITSNGFVRYVMVSLTGSRTPSSLEQFAQPAQTG